MKKFKVGDIVFGDAKDIAFKMIGEVLAVESTGGYTIKYLHKDIGDWTLATFDPVQSHAGGWDEEELRPCTEVEKARYLDEPI